MKKTKIVVSMLLILALVVVGICFGKELIQSKYYGVTLNEYFTYIDIPDLKYTEDVELLYKGEHVDGYFDPLETKKNDDRYVGVVYTNNLIKGSRDQLILLAVKDDKGKVVDVRKITIEEVESELLGKYDW